MLDGLNGSGTRDDPYQITSGRELACINEDLSAFYKLSNDIKFENTTIAINKKFSGVFDGQDYEIKGIKIENTKLIDSGLFRTTTKDAIIRNVGLIDVQIEDSDFDRFTGSLVGFNLGEISNVYSTGTVNGDVYTGGIVGYNSGDVSNSYYTGTVNGGARTGGLVGENRGLVNCCWATLENSEYPLIGLNEEGDNCTVFGFEECNGLSLEGTDVRLDANDWSMSYDIDSRTLRLVHNNKTYDCPNTSPMEVQELVYGLDQYVVEVSNKFKASVISNI